nr:reverse transcriptase domain-containing protein [Tanacetum cinerariifolium]
KTYDGTGDPENHVKIFQAATQVEHWAMSTWYHMFNSTLIGAARVWYNELPPESIDSYIDLKAAFLEYFMQQKKYVKDPVEIHNIKQKDEETIEDFMERFKVETGRMKGASECMRIFEFMHGVNNLELTKRLNEHVPKTMEEMMITTTAFIRGEAATASKKKPPPPMVTPVEKRSSNKFCDFHNDKGHSTDECMQLKKQIEELVRASKLLHLIKEIKHGRDQSKAGKKETPAKDKPATIYMIHSWQRMTRKKVTPSFESVREITFPPLATSDGAEGPLVIETEIGGHMIHRMYVDGGSSVEILYEHCFNRLRPEVKNQMVPTTTSLTSFSGETIWPLGQLRLLVTIGDADHSTRAWMNFMIVRLLSPYNGIIRRSGIKEIQAVPSTAHEMLKFPVDGGIVTIRSTILIPAKCATMITSSEEVAIRGMLSAEGRTELCSLLKENLDIFAWQPSDMTGVPRSIAEHRLNIREGYSPVRQKKRGQAPECAKAIQAEVKKLVEAEIMRDVYYHDWLSNLVMVKKHDVPKPKEELIVYMSVSYGAISAVLMTERGTVQMPVYFVSSALQDPELNYTPMEKLVLSLVFAAKRLRSVMLGENNIMYRQRTSVKGQVLADFLAEMPNESSPDASVVETQQEPWTLFTDGLSCVDRASAGLIITSLEGTKLTYALRFQFAAFNNEAEYEALITGLWIAAQMGVINVHVSVDSKLVANQVLGTYVSKEENMIKYLEKVKSLVLVEILKENSIQEKEVTTVVEEDGPMWMTPVMEYLKEGTLPSDRKEERKLRIKARQVCDQRNSRRVMQHARGTTVSDGQSHMARILLANDAPRCARYDTKSKPKLGGRNQGLLGEGNKNWVEGLPHVLWAHRTMIKSSPGDTPFSLTYGTEAVIPTEIGMPTYRTTSVDVAHNDEELRLNLVLLEERRECVAIREAKSKLKMTKYYNARVYNVIFRPCDFVDHSNDASHDVDGGKLGPKWEGPYEVTKALGDGAYKLRFMDGTVLPRTWNITNLKKCYL